MPLCPPNAGSAKVIERAARIAALNASTERTSGGAAPARTATPTPMLPRSSVLLAATCPDFARFASICTVVMTTSPLSPSATRLTTDPAVP